jgi:hypothetical protein
MSPGRMAAWCHVHQAGRDTRPGRIIRYHLRYQGAAWCASGVARAIFDRAFVFGVIFGVFDAFGRVLLVAERSFGILADRVYRGVQRVVRVGALPIRGASLAFVRVVMVFLLPVICHEWTLPGD